jgi:Cys-rich protein (TIGR04453 family)
MSVHSLAARLARGPLFAVSLVAALGLALAGCGYSPSDYCQEYCDCTGCSDNELDECIDNAEDSYDNAIDEGCEDQADEYLSCLSDETECRDGNRFDADGCEDESVDVAKCVN